MAKVKKSIFVRMKGAISNILPRIKIFKGLDLIFLVEWFLFQVFEKNNRKTIENMKFSEKRIFFLKIFEFAQNRPLFVVLNQFSSLHPSHFVLF